MNIDSRIHTYVSKKILKKILTKQRIPIHSWIYQIIFVILALFYTLEAICNSTKLIFLFWRFSTSSSLLALNQTLVSVTQLCCSCKSVGMLSGKLVNFLVLVGKLRAQFGPA